MKHIHCLQHVSFEGLGYIETWAKSKSYSVTYTRFYENDPLPDEKNFDCLIVMGGPMGVYDEKKYPWLTAEKRFIHECIWLGKKVLGICLGAQLIAEACGARVYPNAKKEIGWFPVSISPSLESFGLSEHSMTVFHWHGDTFDLPIGAINHVSSAACKQQLFTLDQNVMGIQFHFEATEKTIAGMLAHGGDEVATAEVFIQTKEEIAGTKQYIQSANTALGFLLDNFI